MEKRTWIILGATSIIAEKFAHLAARAGNSLLLIARDKEQLKIITADISLRYSVQCHFIHYDFLSALDEISTHLQSQDEFDLFIAQSAIFENDDLDNHVIDEMIQVNIRCTVLLIHAYLNKPQNKQQLLFLSSVAANRGRAKNSFYGGTKAMIETYLQGIQQQASANLTITIAKLGFIDTRQTYGLPGIFYASPPEACAKACWQAIKARKPLIYHPFFWRFIMGIIQLLPNFIYKKLGKL